MKLDTRILAVVGLTIAISPFVAAQVLLDNQELSVPQRCALLLTEEPVVKKLSLNQAQTKAFEHAVKVYLADSKKLSSSKTATDNDRVAADKRFADACLATLTPEQKHTILQIGVPRIGTLALIDPTVVAAVGLTPSQAKQIKELVRDFAKQDEDVSAMVAHGIETIPVPKPGADHSKYDKKCLEVAKMYDGERQRIAREKAETDAKIFAIMTPAEQTKWGELAGPMAKK